MKGRFPLPLAAALGALPGLGCGSKPPAPPTLIPVTVATVEQRAIPYEIAATGTVEPLQTVAVQSQVSGILSRVNFKEGDEVRSGQVLFEIDPRPYQAALAQARAILDRDAGQLRNAELDVERYAALAQKDYVTVQQYDQVKGTAASLRSTLQGDSAIVENARLNLEFASIRAPITGRVGSLLVRQGNLVHAGGSTALVVINQIHPILVRFAVPSASLPVIQRYRTDKPVVRVQVPNAAPDPIDGTLSFIDNAVDTITGTLQLKGLFSNPDGTLWPGEFVTVKLQLYVQRAAIVVPAQSVVSGQQGSYVFVIAADSSANTRLVTVGRTVGDVAVIDKGLSAGEIVVTDGQLRLTAGARVEINRAPAGAPGAGR